MDNVTGAIVEDDDFFPRDKFIKRLKRGIDKNNYILSAPRRSGKSSILRDIQTNQQEENLHFVHFNVEGAKDENDYFDIIIRYLKSENILNHNTIFDYLEDKASQLEVKGISIKKSDFNIEDFIEAISSNISDEFKDKKIVLAIDEFSTFLAKISKQDEDRAKEFLNINRTLRTHKNISQKFRFIYTGSIGLINIVEKLNFSLSINDLDSIKLKPLIPKEANEFVNQLFLSYDLECEDDIIDYFLDKVKWYMPFFIQLLFKFVEEYLDENDISVCTKEIIDIAYEEIFDMNNRKHFSHWKERLKDVFNKSEVSFITEILNQISSSDIELYDNLDIENIKAKYKLKYDANHYIDSLIYDGYIMIDDDLKDSINYRFVSPILKQWWLKDAK